MFKNLNDFDFSINPADNFYYFCNGNWLKNQTIPKKYTSWGTFEILFEENQKKIKTIIDTCIKKKKKKKKNN